MNKYYYYKTEDNSGLLKLCSPSRNKDYIAITEQEYNSLLPQKPVINPNKDKLKRITKLKSLLAKTDYEAIKFAEGEMSAEDYEPYKVQRRAWRSEINELEASL